MRRVPPAICFVLAPVLALAAEPAIDLVKEIEQLKKQVAALAQGAAARPLKIGAVNIGRVFAGLEEKTDMDVEVRQIDEKRTARLRKLDDRIRELEDKAKLLRPDSEEAKKNAELLEGAAREFRSYRDATEDDFYSKLYDFMLDIYKRIRDEAQAYAREAGYDVVLRTRDAEVGDIDKAQRPFARYRELQGRIDIQSVLYHGPALDFTDAVIKRLNEKYQRAKAERERLQPTKTPAPTPEEKGKEKDKPKDSPSK